MTKVFVKKDFWKKSSGMFLSRPVGAALCAIMRIFLLQNLMKKYDSSEKYVKSVVFLLFIFLTQF